MSGVVLEWLLTLQEQGKYTVNADVYTKDDEHITCLTATVTFARKSLGGMFDL